MPHTDALESGYLGFSPYLCKNENIKTLHTKKHTKMKISQSLSAAAIGLLALSSCSKMGSLTADNFTVTPNPMEAIGGKVPVTIDGRFPEKFMKTKAVVSVIPEIRWQGGSQQGQATTFQGEKVLENATVIPYKVGGNYTVKNTFNYEAPMEKSELYLTFKAKVGNKTVKIPDLKVADGVISTSELLARTLQTTGTSLAPDAYQRVIKQKQQANIQFLIQQANIRNSELKKTSVTDFVKTLRSIKADEERKNLQNVEISAYASPDGGVKLNEKLAVQREKSTNKAVSRILKSNKISTNVDTKYTAQDWEGFQELVSRSNLQDKDVILRVLSMYKDPQQREEQIKNISSAFRELADEILPQLRRARLTVNYELIGRSDEEIKTQLKDDASKLSVEEVLYAATLTENTDEKESIYKTATKLYPSDYRAYNNLATLAYAKGNTDEADSYLAKASTLAKSGSEVYANRGLLALRKGNVEEAQQELAKGTSAQGYEEILGNIYLAQGNYAAAAKSLSQVKSNSAALAQLLNKDYASARQTLATIAQPDATTAYLKAILGARTGDKSAAMSNLEEALSKDNTLRDYASKDLEFRNYFTDAQFQNLVK